MKHSTKILVVTLHVLLGSFFLPFGLMYAVTGGLYTFETKGSYVTESFSVPLENPLPTDPQELLKLSAGILAEKQSPLPTGKASVKKGGTSWLYEWTGSQVDFILEPTSEPLVAKASIKRTTPHRFFVQLHKAKGGLPFKILAGGFSVALIVMFLSGVVLSLANEGLTRMMWVSSAAGTIVFGVFAALS